MKPTMDTVSVAGKIQVLFLVDYASSSREYNSKDPSDHLWRRVCLACTRILLYLSNFPNREQIKNVQWNSKLFSSLSSAPIKLPSKFTHFQEVSTNNLETFFSELKNCNSSSRARSNQQTSTSVSPINLLYNALAAGVQDYPWDAPEIASPVRTRTLSRPHRTRGHCHSYTQSRRQYSNFIFICSSCPQTERELKEFCGLNETIPLKEFIRAKLLPSALSAQLEVKGVSLHWVHFSQSLPTGEQTTPTLSLFSELLAHTGGTLISDTALVGSAHTTQQTTTVSVNAPSDNTQEIRSSLRSLAIAQAEFEEAASVNKKNTSSISSSEKRWEEFNISASLFPSSSYLEKFLQVQRSDQTKLELAQENNLYWFCTAAGKILCVVELNSMYHIGRGWEKEPHLTGLPPPNKKESSSRTNTQKTAEKGQGNIRNKPSLSKTDKKTGSKSILHPNRVNPDVSSNGDTWNDHPDIPRMVLMGVVNQRDLPLPFLCPTSCYSCSSVYISRQIRCDHTLPSTPPFAQGSNTKQESPPQSMDYNTQVHTPTNILLPHIFKSPERSNMNSKPTQNTLLTLKMAPKQFPNNDNLQFTRSPQIHLSRMSVTSPGSRVRRKLLTSCRRRTKSASDIRSTVSIRPLTVNIERCAGDVLVKQKSKSQRSVSMSPRHSLLKPTNTRKNSAQVPHPKDCLSEKRFHSRMFQTLCVWLAKNGYYLVIQVFCVGGASCLAILQPVTSLIATVTTLRPQHQTSLLSKLIPLETLCQTTEASWQSAVRAKVGGARERSKANMGVSDDTQRSKVDPTAELLMNISVLLCGPHTEESNNTFRPPTDNYPPFTNSSLLPWFSYTEHSGLNKTGFSSLSRLQSEHATEDRGRSQLVSKLRAVYSNEVATAVANTPSLCGLPSEAVDCSNECLTKDQEAVESSDAKDVTKESEVKGPPVDSVEELCSWFQTVYHEQLTMELDQHLMGDTLQRWSTDAVAKFVASFTILSVNNYEATIQITKGQLQAQLWEQLNGSVLVNGDYLSQKYEELFKGLSNRTASKYGEDREDSSRKDNEVLANQRISEYLLQVFLRFEALKICSGFCQDPKAVSNQLIFMLRKISLLSNPGLLGNLMKKIVLPLYIDNCKSVLLEIYEGLMLPIPPDLNPDPESDVEGVGVVSQDDSSEEEPVIPSLEESLPQGSTTSARRLARHASFQDSGSQRQISIVSKKKRKKKNKITASRGLEVNATIRRSPRLAKKGAEKTKGQASVCRSLFARSQSLCKSATSFKRRLSDDRQQEQLAKRKKTGSLKRHSTMTTQVLAMETPVKKQVENYQQFKLQRLRSKSKITSPDVIAIEESPRRSFYSKPRITRTIESDSAQFKTPPIKDKKASPSGKLLLKKEPSPATLHSLLHGEILSPLSKTHSSAPQTHTQTKNFSTESPLKKTQTAEVVHQSPELFAQVSGSPSIQALKDCNVIGRTPSKSVGDLSVAKQLLEAAASQVKTSGVKTARMLTYDSEHQAQHGILSSESNSSNVTSLFESTATSPQQELTILDIPSLYAPCSTQTNTSVPRYGNVVLVSPPDSPPTDRVAVDPILENESASMMAFALCTPTKEDRRDFLGVCIEPETS